MTDVYPRIETGNTAPANPPRLLDVVHEKAQALHYSRRMEEAYVHWIRDYVRFHGKRHPRDMGAAEVEAFLSHLANARNVSTSTHQQALSALLFLYKRVLDIDLPWLGDLTRPKKPQRLPAVLTREEVNTLLAHMEGTPLLMARLLYGIKVSDTIIFFNRCAAPVCPGYVPFRSGDGPRRPVPAAAPD